MTLSVLEDLGQDLAMMARLVQSQLMNAMTAFFQRDLALARRVTEKDDQIDNLLGLIEEKCFERIAGDTAGSPRSRRLRGVFRVALNLEKLGDYAVNIAEQATHASRFGRRPLPFDLANPARVALDALDEVITSFTRASAEKAKHACRCEPELDRRYREALAEAFRRLAQPGQDPAFIITNLFVSKFLERIGDSILNIGETTLFILSGERLKLHQYLHLEQMVSRVAPQVPEGDLSFSQIWGGISGARVGRLSLGPGGPLIWKEGAEKKIEDEIREMDEWNRLVPGLVPDVKARYEQDGRTSFLGQYVDGALLRDVYMLRPWPDKVRITRRLLETVRDAWLATAESERPRLDYVHQISDRLPELYAMHPELGALRRVETRVFGIPHPSLPELLERAAGLETHLAPPVSVRIHGDFNSNNILYDERHDEIHFIDVHRSGPGDYLQDIGVLLVSNLRNPIEDPRIVRELERLNGLIAEFAGEFARLIGDTHFETRLVLSQARSFLTSSRLVTDPAFARSIFLKGVRWLERAVGLAAA
jgi:phosphate uptake regulator